jgi:hypothetical protein
VYMHPEMETTEYKALGTTTSKYSLTNEYRKIHSVSIIEAVHASSPSETARRHRLMQRLPRDFDPFQKQTRKPTEYCHWARQIELDAVPDSTWGTYSLQIRGYIIPADISASAATLISADWDEVIIMGMVHRYWLAVGQDDKIETSREDYWRLIGERGGFHIQSSDDFAHSVEMASETIDWRQG